MIKLASRFVVLRLDAEKDQHGKELSQKHGVQGFPTILFLDANGEVHGKIGGYLPPKSFGEQMDKIRATFEDLPKLTEKLAKEPNDGAANARMAQILAGRGKAKDAKDHLDKAEKAKFAGAELYEAHNAIGDLHQNSGNAKTAMEHFRKVAEAEKASSAARSYAKVSIVFCLAQSGDLKQSEKEARVFLELKDADPEQVKAVKNLLTEIEKRKQRGG